MIIDVDKFRAHLVEYYGCEVILESIPNGYLVHKKIGQPTTYQQNEYNKDLEPWLIK